MDGFNLRYHIMSIYGLTPESTVMARFYRDGKLIAENPVTADECYSVKGYWSGFMLADGASARKLGATSVAFV